MLHHASCINKGKFKVVNDTFMQLYSNSGNMAITGNVEHSVCTSYYCKNGVLTQLLDTFVDANICGFPSPGDTVSFGGYKPGEFRVR
jgi:hypothetical protein